jgi:hypothetical protein
MERFDQTILPWTSLWLLYFEEWLTSHNRWRNAPEVDDNEEAA